VFFFCGCVLRDVFFHICTAVAGSAAGGIAGQVATESMLPDIDVGEGLSQMKRKNMLSFFLKK
jgi:hypothetical protein